MGSPSHSHQGHQDRAFISSSLTPPSFFISISVFHFPYFYSSHSSFLPYLLLRPFLHNPSSFFFSFKLLVFIFLPLLFFPPLLHVLIFFILPSSSVPYILHSSSSSSYSSFFSSSLILPSTLILSYFSSSPILPSSSSARPILPSFRFSYSSSS